MMNSTQLAIDLENELKKLGLLPTWDECHPLWMLIPRECSKLRQNLNSAPVTEEISQRIATFWDISDKYRFDLLGYEIAWIADQLAFAAGLASLHRPHMKQTSGSPYNRPVMSDSLFWFYIDAGLRNASSCWERVGIFLDLAFGLGLRSDCSFPKSLKNLEKNDLVKKSIHFQNLTRFRDGRFQELEARKGVGARHEATHVISPRLRHWAAEVIEPLMDGKPSLTTGRDPDYWIRFLVEHHGLYLNGAQDAIALVASR
ncbi:MAG: hypothetical protein Q7K29_01290 [Thermoleophilia bacterium]|nr:hypothetical protein [Thermoleophilia bacterium]